MTDFDRLRPALAAFAGLVLCHSDALACCASAAVTPTGTITTEDPVALAIVVNTSTYPAHLYQPTEVTIDGNDIIIEVFVDGVAGYGSRSYQGFLMTPIAGQPEDTSIPTVSEWGLTLMTLLLLLAGTLAWRRIAV